MSPRVLSALNWVGHVVLGAGLAAPCMTVTPHLGQVEGLAKWLGLMEEPRTYSVATGVFELLRGGHLVIGGVLLLFSVVFPVWKLVALRLALRRPRSGHPLSARLAKFSMVDVFVIALLVVAGKTFPGGTTVDVRWGVYAFAAAALLSMVVSGGVARLPPT